MGESVVREGPGTSWFDAEPADLSLPIYQIFSQISLSVTHAEELLDFLSRNYFSAPTKKKRNWLVIEALLRLHRRESKTEYLHSRELCPNRTCPTVHSLL